MKIAVIGGGASGMMSAGVCAKNGNQVDLFESNEKLGKKLFITGKGRCNITNNSTNEEFLENVVNNNKFLYSSLNNFNCSDTIKFFNDLGLETKVERGKRVFPCSDKSSDVIKTLERFLIKNKVNILLNSKVEEILIQDEKFIIKTNRSIYKDYDKVICCTGGKTYPATGSTGDGYKFANKFGHNITDIKPGLVPIILNDGYIKQIQGLSLKNVTLKSFVNGKPFKELFGEMLFTHNGISGPIALSMSSYINKKENITLMLDFKPALSDDKLTDRIKRDIQELYNSQVSTLLAGLLPKALVEIFLDKVKIPKDTKCKSLNITQISSIVNLLKNFKLEYKSLERIDFGIITSGGVNVKEINPKTMESKLVKNLYFAGEVIDVDALTGGFNLQIAFSTGYTAGQIS